VTPGDGPAGERELLLDDQLAKMMLDWYTYFAGVAPKPAGDLRFNVGVMDAIASAKRLAGIEEAGQIVWAPRAEMPV
jgi:hypothetical protein